MSIELINTYLSQPPSMGTAILANIVGNTRLTIITIIPMDRNLVFCICALLMASSFAVGNIQSGLCTPVDRFVYFEPPET